MSTESTARSFFAQHSFAVVGASSNPAKYGYKIFAWYTNHALPVVPINPGSPTIAVEGAEYDTKPSLSALQDPKNTGVSIITPPKVTMKLLKEARELGIPAVWMQPGSFDDEVESWARGEGGFGSVVAGDGGMGGEGWCVLVDGEKALRGLGKL
ncbi:CoA binding domain-containing protein [Zalerion maritima]|uniref:CoA binding domain-containing protein n=1 Tax=Zalerion maritima TaxID=339359 RepID=A0AAD5RV42_9PEZI|nr:CoA binding domain-containing protein [Zalerion maritima]